MDIDDCIRKRKSVRNFEEKKIEDEVLTEILNAAILAPSPKNSQPWRFKVIKRGNEKDRILNALYLALEEKKEEWDAEACARRDIEEAFASLNILKQADVLVCVFAQLNQKEEMSDGLHWELQATERESTYIQAIGACIENMLLKATSVGVGSLWVCDFLFAYDAIVQEMKINLPLIAIVALGYPSCIEKSISPKTKCQLEELML